MSKKQELLAEFSRIAKAVASPVRLEILDYLAQGECSVEFLAEKCGQKTGNISQHLRLLLSTGLVSQRREGTFIYYRSTAAAESLVESLGRAASEVLPKVQQLARTYFQAKSELCRKEGRELLADVERGEILLIDVRPADEYAQGHIAGARSVPLKKLVTELGNLPRGKEIVAYCRGPWCVLAVEAVAVLKKNGLNASRLEDGFPQWRAKKLPVAI